MGMEVVVFRFNKTLELFSRLNPNCVHTSNFIAFLLGASKIVRALYTHITFHLILVGFNLVKRATYCSSVEDHLDTTRVAHVLTQFEFLVNFLSIPCYSDLIARVDPKIPLLVGGEINFVCPKSILPPYRIIRQIS
jgi:hypothetical protein